MGDVDKVLTWKWNGFEVRLENAGDSWTVNAWDNGEHVYQTRTTLFNTFHPTSRKGMAAMVHGLGAVAPGLTMNRRQMLLALHEDITQTPELLDWWECEACGLESFLVPDDLAICVWCGEVRSGE